MKTNAKKSRVASTVSTLLAGVAGLGVASTALATTPPGACPAAGVSNGCNLVITLNANGTASVAQGSSPGTYDSSDDTLIGVINNSGQTVNSINLSASTDIFGFDGDGIGLSFYAGIPGDSGPSHGATYFGNQSGYSGTDSPSTSYDLSGPLNSFSNIGYGAMSGTVNFGSSGLANGGSAFFALEEPLTSASFTATTTSAPEPGSLALLAAGLAGMAGLGLRRRRKKI